MSVKQNESRQLLCPATSSKRDYERTRFNDSRQLPALILGIFFVNILGLSLIFGLSTMVLYDFFKC